MRIARDSSLDLTFSVQTKIQKPVNDVFDAVYNPKKLNKYFTTAADRPLDEGETVEWKFTIGRKVVKAPVKVRKVIVNRLIQFSWEASEGAYDPKAGKIPDSGGYYTNVEISFEPLNKNETLVKIIEGKWKPTQSALEGSYGNCQGWTQMLDFLKAYLEYGINLRKGAY